MDLRDNFLNNGLVEEFTLKDENIFLEKFVPLVVFSLKDENILEKRQFSKTGISLVIIGAIEMICLNII